MRRLSSFILFCLVSAFVSLAMTLQDAKNLYRKGEYAKALPEFERQYKKNPRNASINHWLGVCLFYEGKYARAEKYLIYADKKEVRESAYYLARLYYIQYRGAEAIEYAEKYEASFDDSKKETIPASKARELELIKRAASMMDHVDNIEVIDSMVVEKDKFFSYYRISPEAGCIESADVLPEGFDNNTGVVFLPQTRSRMMWSMTDSVGVSHIVESTMLHDKSWDKPHIVGDNLGEGGDVCYPFMMPDGATLYFAGNGDNSIGGYDIFMTRRDSESLEYYKPQNMGYPYNSPYDDYLLVIDEFTGVGWWATDRNRIDDMLTIYIFKSREVRDNYSTDNPNLPSLAALRSIKDTWREGADYSALLDAIAAIEDVEPMVDREFEFELPNGKIYYNFDDFKSADARKLMTDLVELQSTLGSKERRLEELRTKYASNRSAALGRNILQLENEVESLRSSIFNMSNKIRTIEK